MSVGGLPGIEVLERGWLSSNNVVLHGRDGEGATLVDTGHVVHAAQTLALVEATLGDAGLARIVNTHLHSDHSGGNATLQRRHRVPLLVPAGGLAAVQAWDVGRLGYADVAQRCERFTADGALAPDDTLRAGATAWAVLAAPGHDPDALMLFEPRLGVLISGDALWEDGFGVVFPELDGEPGFEAVRETLAHIEALQPRVVIPGHGRAFADVAAALARARSRLARFEAAPLRHARHAAKVLLTYHLMEEGVQALPALLGWAAGAPLMQRIWARQGHPEGSSAGWAALLVDELVQGGAMVLRDGVLSST